MVGIPLPHDANPSHTIAQIPLEGNGIATSGDYEQFWVVRHPDGSQETYFHVIDPASGHPLKIRPNSLASVTVLAPTCTMADALATACLLFPSPSEAQAWAEKVQKIYPTVQFWFILRGA